MKKKMHYVLLLFTIISLVGCANVENASIADQDKNSQEETTVTPDRVKNPQMVDEPVVEETPTQANKEQFSGYKFIEVDGGDLSGDREPNVVVDIGYGDREYWAFTNEYGQLVRVIAAEIILQDDKIEAVLSSGRYYADEAKVPGVESAVLDEGHVIADALGGYRTLFEQNL